MEYQVLLPPSMAAEGRQYLIDRGYRTKIASGVGEEDYIRDVADCHAILVRTAPITARVLEAGKQLRVVAKHGVGVDNIDVATAARLGIRVTNTPLANTNSVAEHTLALLLGLAKNLVYCDRELRKGNFDLRFHLLGTELAGKTLGIVGLGNVGRTVARMAMAGFNMQVVGYDPHVDTAKLPAGVQVVEWETLFRTADFVTLHLPLLPATRHLVGAREFSWMKPSACFVNAARGEIVDEAALIQALRAKQIAGAALDVFAQEPPGDNPLWALDNVIVSPHNAALTREASVRMAVQAAQGIHEVLSGQEPTWPVV